MDLTARIRFEGETYWAGVDELPGVFARGDTLDELFESLQEAVTLYLADDEASGGSGAPLRVASATLSDRPLTPA